MLLPELLQSSQSAGAVNEQFTATAIQDTGDTRDYVIDKSDSTSTSTPVILRSQGDTELKVKVGDKWCCCAECSS